MSIRNRLLLSALLTGCLHLLAPGMASAGQWAVTAIPFKLVGSSEVNNVKLMWDKDSNAETYRIYRNDELLGEVSGYAYDDYGLPVDKTVYYRIEAIGKNGYCESSYPAKVNTFTTLPTQVLSVYDNLDGKYLQKDNSSRPEGFNVKGRYYKYSINRGPNKQWVLTESVSKDGLTGWSVPRDVYNHPDCKFEGNAFHYNPNTGKVVFSSHYEDEQGYKAAKIFLAEITPGGSLTVGTAERPLGHDSRDQSLFIDSDNTAYLLSATNTNQDINIYRLDESWTKPVELCNTICKGAHRETPFITKVDGEYYFFSSKASGWYPSQTLYCSASDISGEWSSLREIGSNSSFDAQFNRIRNWENTSACWSYHWGAQRKYKTPAGNFPRITMLAFNHGSASMAYFRHIEFNEKYGVIPIQNGKNLTLHKSVTSKVKGSDGIKASCITDGAMCESSDYFKKSASSAFGQPYILTIDMENPVTLSEINLATRLVNGSECAFKYTIEGSLDNQAFDMLVDGRNSWEVGFIIKDVESTKTYRYLRLRIFDITSVHKGNSQNWADGIYELTAYGKTPQ